MATLHRRLEMLERQAARRQAVSDWSDLTPAGRAAKARLDAGVPREQLTTAELEALLDNPLGRWVSALSGDERQRILAGDLEVIGRAPL